MNRADMFPSKYLAASDLDEEGNAYVIESVYVEKMRDGKEKPILVLKGAPKDMVLNVTNWNSIAKQHGDESDDWEGKSITIYPSETEMNGDTVACIRVRGRKPKPASPSKKAVPKGTPEAEKAIAAAVQAGPDATREPGDDDDSDVPY